MKGMRADARGMRTPSSPVLCYNHSPLSLAFRSYLGSTRSTYLLRSSRHTLDPRQARLRRRAAGHLRARHAAGLTLVVLPALRGAARGDSISTRRSNHGRRRPRQAWPRRPAAQLQEQIRKDAGGGDTRGALDETLLDRGRLLRQLGAEQLQQPARARGLPHLPDAGVALAHAGRQLAPRSLRQDHERPQSGRSWPPSHHLPIIPLINNYVGGTFDWKTLQLLLQDPDRQQAVARRLREYVETNHFAGINIDFEAPYYQIPEEQQRAAGQLVHDALPEFMELLRKEFAPRHLLVTQDLPAADGNEDLDALDDANDFLIVMLYDQHTASSGSLGPIAESDLGGGLRRAPAAASWIPPR